jgi:hypothetical protein
MFFFRGRKHRQQALAKSQTSRLPYSVDCTEVEEQVSIPRPAPSRVPVMKERPNQTDTERTGNYSVSLFGALLVLAIIRLCVSSNILNLVMNYSSTGGMFLEKIHPASWALLVLTAVLVPRIANNAVWAERKIIVAMLTMATMTCLAAMVPLVNGSSDLGLGYLVDSILTACAAASIMFVLSDADRRRIGHVLLSVLVLNSVLAIVEFSLKVRILPSPYEREIFRALGVLSHPLELGLCNAAAIAFVYMTRWSAARKLASVLVLIVATLAAGARTASVIAPIAAMAGFLLAKRPLPGLADDRHSKIIVVIAVVLLAPAAWSLIDLTGLNERFQVLGVADESANTRIVIFQVFELANWRDLIFGAGLETLQRLAQVELKIPSVENPIVVYIFQFGIVGTIFILTGLIVAVYALCKGTLPQVKIGLAAFFIVALSSNSLATKSPDLVLVFLLAVAFSNIESQGRAGRWGVRRTTQADVTKNVIRARASAGHKPSAALSPTAIGYLED